MASFLERMLCRHLIAVLIANRAYSSFSKSPTLLLLTFAVWKGKSGCQKSFPQPKFSIESSKSPQLSPPPLLSHCYYTIGVQETYFRPSDHSSSSSWTSIFPWKTLSRIPKFPDWNPYIQRIAKLKQNHSSSSLYKRRGKERIQTPVLGQILIDIAFIESSKKHQRVGEIFSSKLGIVYIIYSCRW